MSAVDDLLGAAPEQDYIILAAVKSPGRAYIKSAGSPRDWDIRKGYGFSGASVVFTGNGLAKFEVDIELWLPSHWLDWKAFAKLLAKPGGLTPIVGLGISHPLLTTPPLSITSVVVEDVSQFVQNEEGSHVCTIKFIEYKRPLPALSKPIAEIPAASKALPTATDAVNAEIAAKAAIFASLAAAP
ncbi:MAG: hypothetical protein M3Y26_08760 [Actinomycetota bacterium]|nr:hypothetical protein [Actinomycetota bacterium]